jgi:phage terminase large subunit GpA-like protein
MQQIADAISDPEVERVTLLKTSRIGFTALTVGALTSRRFPGGALKVVAARSPRNLRRHTARILIVDEADACEVGAEGDPIRLAERRTLTFANRKIIIGSTSIFADTSAIIRSFAESDMRFSRSRVPNAPRSMRSSGWTSSGSKASRRRQSIAAPIARRSLTSGTRRRWSSAGCGGRRSPR